ncbi:hypothetical protein GGX14DRAFT_402138 [Mycena pura]|uniref:Uncharacterized protein n=1 Tax=Mycena pura TaxID=153505 RepID=A0AAD6V2Q7_9AGAR|nr:hypothetical protein GGX14DRAFT_402138 [Mycena pura]
MCPHMAMACTCLAETLIADPPANIMGTQVDLDDGGRRKRHRWRPPGVSGSEMSQRGSQRGWEKQRKTQYMTKLRTSDPNTTNQESCRTNHTVVDILLGMGHKIRAKFWVIRQLNIGAIS